LRIWIDADACPRIVKEIVYKASARLQIPVSVVANSPIAIPRSPLIVMVQVAKGSDVADHHILSHLVPDDLIITADIPLAAEVVTKGAIALNPRGETYTAQNVGELLSLRNFMDQMRGSGLAPLGGPAEYGAAEQRKFAGAFDRLLAKKTKEIKK
jgi:uncharacterized protein